MSPDESKLDWNSSLFVGVSCIVLIIRDSMDFRGVGVSGMGESSEEVDEKNVSLFFG